MSGRNSDHAVRLSNQIRPYLPISTPIMYLFVMIGRSATSFLVWQMSYWNTGRVSYDHEVGRGYDCPIRYQRQAGERTVGLAG